MKIAILTGDIIDSTQLSPEMLEKIMWTLDDAHFHIQMWRNLPSFYARRGGDGWQLVLSAPELDLRAALYLRASLRKDHPGTDTRIALATGDGDMSGQTDPNSGHGPAFVASGRLLSVLKGRRQMAHANGGAHDATLSLADHLSQGWTQAQARALCETLPPKAGPRAQAAKHLGISRQSVNDALWSAGYPALERALKAWEANA